VEEWKQGRKRGKKSLVRDPHASNAQMQSGKQGKKTTIAD